jgi:hypothetical protein
MKKIIWITLFLTGISLTIFGVTTLDTSAREAEMYLDVIIDSEETTYVTNFHSESHRRLRPPLVFKGLMDSMKTSIEERALALDVEVNHYVLAKTLSMYDITYDFDTMILELTSREGDALIDYENQLQLDLEVHLDDIKLTLDTLREKYQLEVKAVREIYKEDIRSLFKSLKQASEEEKESLLLTLDALKVEIQDAMNAMQLSFISDLEEEQIAIEGLYFLFIERIENTQHRLAQFERRFPKAFDKVKHHFNR